MSTTLTVTGMSCGHCEQTVEGTLSGVAGVTRVTADRERDVVTVEGDADTAALVTAIEEAGYESSA